MKQMAGRLKISKGQKGQKKVTHEKKRRRQNNKSNEILFRATLVLFILQRRVGRGARAQEARWRGKKKKKRKESSYFCNCFFFFFFTSAERKVVGKVLRNLNRPDSQGVVVLIFSYREKTPLL